MRVLNLLIVFLFCIGLCCVMSSCNKNSDGVDNNSSINNNNNNIGDNNSDVTPPPPQKVEKSYMITYSAECDNYNSVGDDWSYGVKFNSDEIESGETVVIDEDETLFLVIFVNEYDAGNSDFSELTLEFSDLECGDEETQEVDVVVTENDGRFKDNTAIWKFTITCNRLFSEE